MKISISQIKAFKACRRLYQLKYVYGFEPVEKPEPLETGTSYHEGIELLYKDKGISNSCSKVSAMIRAYREFLRPHIEIEQCEKWVEYPIHDDRLVGRVDGVTPEGVLVEHKTTSQPITEAYEYGLQWDEQILAYMLCTGAREMIYTVCRKPTLRQKKGESDFAFYERLCDWYFDGTENKIKMFYVYRTDNEVNQFKQDLESIIFEIKHCKDVDGYYKNTLHCSRWGRMCEYAPICLQCDPEQDYIEFNRREKD